MFSFVDVYVILNSYQHICKFINSVVKKKLLLTFKLSEISMKSINIRCTYNIAIESENCCQIIEKMFVSLKKRPFLKFSSLVKRKWKN